MVNLWANMFMIEADRHRESIKSEGELINIIEKMAKNNAKII